MFSKKYDRKVNKLGAEVDFDDSLSENSLSLFLEANAEEEN